MPETPDFIALTNARAHVQEWLYKNAASGYLIAREVEAVEGIALVGVSFVARTNFRVDSPAPELEGVGETQYGRTLARSELANIAIALAS